MAGMRPGDGSVHVFNAIADTEVPALLSYLKLGAAAHCRRAESMDTTSKASASAESVQSRRVGAVLLQYLEMDKSVRDGSERASTAVPKPSEMPAGPSTSVLPAGSSTAIEVPVSTSKPSAMQNANSTFGQTEIVKLKTEKRPTPHKATMPSAKRAAHPVQVEVISLSSDSD